VSPDNGFAPAIASDVAVTAWQQRRSAFTHDWLGNRLLPRLRACIAVARGDVAASGETIATLLTTLREWPVRGQEVLRLTDEFYEVMSPLRAIDDIASFLPQDVASYLRRTTLEVWKMRHRVAEVLSQVRTAHALVDRSYIAWMTRCDVSSAPGDRIVRTAALADIAENCERLSRVLSSLPGRVLF
jgi:hypothetical protein